MKNYFYRADDRMSGYSDASSQVTYYHDALGRRVAKVFSGAAGSLTQSFVHLGQEDRILQAKAGDGAVTTYLDGLGVDEHLAEEKNGVGKGYVADHLQSVLNGDAAGATHSFGLWGEQIAMPAILASSNPVMYGFTGREHDAESGLDYHRARSRNKSLGSWMSQDPIGYNSKDSNNYRYVFNSPMLYTDPSGLKCWKTQAYGDATMIAGLACSGAAPPVGVGLVGGGILLVVAGEFWECDQLPGWMPGSKPKPVKPDPNPPKPIIPKPAPPKLPDDPFDVGTPP